MRQILDFNENWWFIHADVDVSEARPGEGELVSLPHTWNALDGQKGDGKRICPLCPAVQRNENANQQ